MATVASCNMSQNWCLHMVTQLLSALSQLLCFSHLSLIELQKPLHTHLKEGAFQTLEHPSDVLSMDTV